MILEDALAFALSREEAEIASAFGQLAIRLGQSGPVVMFTKPHASGNQVSLKLAYSAEFASTLPGVRPMGHGYGRYGWVTISLDDFGAEPHVLFAFIEESHEHALRRRLG